MCIWFGAYILQTKVQAAKHTHTHMHIHEYAVSWIHDNKRQ